MKQAVAELCQAQVQFDLDLDCLGEDLYWVGGVFGTKINQANRDEVETLFFLTPKIAPQTKNGLKRADSPRSGNPLKKPQTDKKPDFSTRKNSYYTLGQKLTKFGAFQMEKCLEKDS